MVHTAHPPLNWVQLSLGHAVLLVSLPRFDQGSQLFLVVWNCLLSYCLTVRISRDTSCSTTTQTAQVVEGAAPSTPASATTETDTLGVHRRTPPCTATSSTTTTVSATTLSVDLLSTGNPPSTEWLSLIILLSDRGQFCYPTEGTFCSPIEDSFVTRPRVQFWRYVEMCSHIYPVFSPDGLFRPDRCSGDHALTLLCHH